MNLRKIFLPVLIITVLIFISTGCELKKNEKAANQINVEKNTGGRIVHDGVINVGLIDANKDGKVFQCPMDVNVISDKPGICPLCKMDLEEVTVATAKDYLTKSDYKVN